MTSSGSTLAKTSAFPAGAGKPRIEFADFQRLRSRREAILRHFPEIHPLSNLTFDCISPIACGRERQLSGRMERVHGSSARIANPGGTLAVNSPISVTTLAKLSWPSTTLPERKFVSPMNSATNLDSGCRYKFRGSSRLPDAPRLQHGHAIGDGKRFLLIVRHVDRGEARFLADPPYLRRASRAADERRDLKAAHPAAGRPAG